MNIDIQQIMESLKNDPSLFLTTLQQNINDAKNRLEEVSEEIKSRIETTPLSELTLSELLLMNISLTLSAAQMVDAFDDLEDCL